MDYDILFKNFDDLNAKVKAAQAEMSAMSKGLIEMTAQRFLDECPEVTGIHWTQYTPYFNDGHTCEFGVNSFCFHILTEEKPEVKDYYESTIIYTQEALEQAKKKLKGAAAFEADPHAWRQQYVKDYQAKYGRSYSSNWNFLRPYPSTTVEAQERIEEITENLETYGPEVAERINRSFQDFCKAMKKIPDSIMQAVYGDHVLVIINREGTSIDEFNHD